MIVFVKKSRRFVIKSVLCLI